MEKSLNKIKNGYANFRNKYLDKDNNISQLIDCEQKPEIMIVSCCDSRVDPAIIFECDPGELFTLRNIAAIVPPYEKDGAFHGTSAGLEFGIKFLKVKHLILMGHSNCGGIMASLNSHFPETDFIGQWLNITKKEVHTCDKNSLETCIKKSLETSYANCFTFPFIKERIENNELKIHIWFFDLQNGKINQYDEHSNSYISL